jgi:uncharacterized protein
MGAIDKNNFFKSAQFIIGLCLIVSSIIFSIAFYNSRISMDSISVTGSASQEVVSDSAKFSGSFSRIVKLNNLKSGYDQMSADLKLVNDFLTEQAIDEKDVTISTVSMEQNYDYNSSNIPPTEKDYTLRQTVEVTSSDINKISTLAKTTQSIINKGVIFSVSPVEYYYKNLPEIRVTLLSGAVADAKRRAEEIVSGTGQKVGVLKSAASGVVQVLPANSLEISDYGTYDTSKINKNVMVTVKAAFDIK